MELRKAAKTCLFIPDFHAKEKSVFLAEYVGYIPKVSARIPRIAANFLKTGEITCDFLSDVKG